MALRLIEMVLQEKDSAEVHELLKEHKVLDHRHLRLEGGEVLVRILMDAEQNEAVLDLLEKRFTGQQGNRVLILPVEATLPRAEAEPDSLGTQQSGESESPDDTPSQRISREELYEDIKDSAQLSRVYLVMTMLSTVVAAIGLQHNSVTIVIGAMVIAPLLGPNMALVLGTALGDLALLRRASLTALAGIGTTIALSILIGILVQVDPALTEIASRTRVAPGDIVLALASGCAGALAFTTGVSAILIGVMVAVALLPPLVAFGMLLGGGHAAPAMGALSLFFMNMVCVNLSGVTTLLVRGVRPATGLEKDLAVKATRIAIGLWSVLLAALAGMVLLLRKG